MNTQRPYVELPWTKPGWLEEVSPWIEDKLSGHNIRLIGEPDAFHQRPWSIVLRLPTDSGICYFKASAPALSHEAALTDALATWQPDCMPLVHASDRERGWLLMPDGGSTLRSHLHSTRDLHHLHKVFQRYAQLQMQMAARVDDLLTLGAFDRRLASLPEQYEQLLNTPDALLMDQSDGLSSAEVRRLRKLSTHFNNLCQQLASSRIPETLHHDDFHDGNIFLNENSCTFFDWGESCVSHPFISLVVGLRSAAYRLDLQTDAPEIIQLRDTYLQTWAAYGTAEDLLEAFVLAQQVGTVCRALTWHHIVSHLDEEAKTEHAGAVPGWLQEFLDAVNPTEEQTL
jgi:hypothetical protein